MTCFHPLDALLITDYTIPIGSKGRRRVAFRKDSQFLASLKNSESFEDVKLPCGQCVGCRLERSRQWAIRCMHEASLHAKNCFITLTFNPEFLETRPNVWSLDYHDWRLFMMRLRKRFGPNIRYYHCGEYGQMCANCNRSLFYCDCKTQQVVVLGRPHYHACLFGFDFDDKEVFRVTDTGHVLYTSKALEELWTDPKTGIQMGFCTIGDVTFESAAYVARYIMKKITGDQEKIDEHYVRFDTGEILKPEYTTMSRRPGIGAGWFEKYKDDVMKKDRIIMRGIAMKPPKFYDGRFELLDSVGLETVKFNREEEAKKHLDNNTPERLNVRRICKESSIKSLVRPFL